jgi:DNA-binding transcriptional ArsR family regulator
VLRLELNASDLASVRVSASWGPLAESLFSLLQLQRRQNGVLIDGWREQASRQLGDRALPLLALMRPSSYIDLHTLIGPAPTIDQALDTLRRVPDVQLRREVTEVLHARPKHEARWVRAWLRDLTAGLPQAQQELVKLLRDYHERIIASHWEGMRAHLDADRAYRSRVMVEGGVNQLLATLHPSVRWRPPILEVNRLAPNPPPADAEPDSVVQHLDGRSLVLVPSVFCLDHPVVYKSTVDEAAPYILFYPALDTAADAAAIWTPRTTQRHDALALLLGNTRAAALDAIAAGCTTTELARRIGVTPATASHHLGVLRQAGLINTRRIGSAVLHTITSLGTALLNGQ